MAAAAIEQCRTLLIPLFCSPTSTTDKFGTHLPARLPACRIAIIVVVRRVITVVCLVHFVGSHNRQQIIFARHTGQDKDKCISSSSSLLQLLLHVQSSSSVHCSLVLFYSPIFVVLLLRPLLLNRFLDKAAASVHYNYLEVPIDI